MSESMGFFWDLYQQCQIADHTKRAEGIDARIAYLESELHRTQTILRDVIGRLERYTGEDIDRDGKIG